MQNNMRLLIGIGMGIGIYCLALFGIPSIGFVRAFVEDHTWIIRGDITQAVLLITSVALTYVLSEGHIAGYGFRSTRVSLVIRPVLVSLIVAFVIIGPGMLWAMEDGIADEGSAQQQMPGGIVKMILSVWILASVSEEVFYRGLLLGFLGPLKALGLTLFGAHVSIPVIVCALLFGLGHLPLLGVVGARMTTSIVIGATALGFVAGYYRERTGSLVPAIAAHMTFNVVGVIAAGLVTVVRAKTMAP